MRESISEMKVPVTLVFSCDGGYLPYLLVAVSSAIRHISFKRNYEIVVLAVNISDLQKQCLEELVAPAQNVTLRVIDAAVLDERLDSWFKLRGRKGDVTSWSYTTYYRLFLGSLLPDRSRTLYLDVDMLVCSDPADLFDFDLQGCTVACAEDTCLIHAPASENVRQRLKRIGHDVPRYFNAGAMVIDLDRWRSENCEHKAEELFCGLQDLLFPDQDILNVLFRNDRVVLPSRWNFLTSRFLDAGLPEAVVRENERILQSADFGIIHYVGGKPWAGYGEAPLSHLWWKEAEEVRRGISSTGCAADALRSCLARRPGGKKLFSLRCQSALLSLKSAFANGNRRRRCLERKERMRIRIAELRSYAG